SAQEVSVGAVQQRYRSIERFPSGAVFNEETGTLRGGAADVRVPLGSWAFAVEGMRASGTVDYDGRTQIGLPLQTRTELRHTAYSMLVLSNVWTDVLQLGAGVGRREIDRRIQPTPPSALYPAGTQGLNERLRSTEWRLAARVFWPLFPGSRLSLEGDWLYNTDGRLKADFLGAFDNTTVPLKDWSAWAARLAWTHRFGPVQLRAYHEWHRFEPPASGAQPLSINGSDAGATFTYPGSEQRIRSIGLQIGYVH
ncbi:MAG TPA: hypothetical protein VFR86_13155, partial [Burkholderiaceae bacterium]|nr:hypothetical protein [Burkholderiaceae bacterium]